MEDLSPGNIVFTEFRDANTGDSSGLETVTQSLLTNSTLLAAF